MKAFWRTLIGTGMAGTVLLFSLNLRAEGRGSGSILYSPLVVSVSSGDFLRCSAVNVGTTVISTVDMSLISTGGAPISGPCHDLRANEECAIVDSRGIAAHCQIGTTNGTIRSVIELFDDQGNSKIILPLT